MGRCFMMSDRPEDGCVVKDNKISRTPRSGLEYSDTVTRGNIENLTYRRLRTILREY